MEDYEFSPEQDEIEEEYWGKDWNNTVNGDASEEHANYQSAWDYSSPNSWLGVR
jgi:hypothetical protein